LDAGNEKMSLKVCMRYVGSPAGLTCELFLLFWTSVAV